MPRGRPRQDPSFRNLELYRELICEGQSQRAVAKRRGVSQPRIARVCRQVNAWLDKLMPAAVAARLPLAPGQTQASQRFHLAIAFRHHQLTQAYEEFLRHFGGPSGAAAYSQLLATQDAGLLPAEFADRLPPRDLIQSAARFARQIDDLASLRSALPNPRSPAATNR